jgi:hypothetical protein
VPPDVTVGTVVVVVGAFVVLLPLAEAVDDDLDVVEVAEVADVVGVTAAGVPLVDDVLLEPPGTSLATTTPTRALAPVAAITAQRVNRRSRTLVRARDSGEGGSLGRGILGDLRCGERLHPNISVSGPPQDPL